MITILWVEALCRYVQYSNSSALTAFSIEKLTWLLRILTAILQLQESEEQRIQSEHCVHDLKTVLDNKEKEVSVSSQKLQDLLLATSGTNTTIKQLEEHVQR